MDTGGNEIAYHQNNELCFLYYFYFSNGTASFLSGIVTDFNRYLCHYSDNNLLSGKLTLLLCLIMIRINKTQYKSFHIKTEKYLFIHQLTNTILQKYTKLYKTVEENNNKIFYQLHLFNLDLRRAFKAISAFFFAS